MTLGVLAIVWFVTICVHGQTAIRATEINALQGTFVNAHQAFANALLEERQEYPTGVRPRNRLEGKTLSSGRTQQDDGLGLTAKLLVAAFSAGVLELLLGQWIHGPDYDIPYALGKIVASLLVTCLVVFCFTRRAKWSFTRLFFVVLIPSLMLFIGVSPELFQNSEAERDRRATLTKSTIEDFSKACKECVSTLTQIREKDSAEDATRKFERMISSLGGRVRGLSFVEGRNQKETEKLKVEVALLIQEKAASLREALDGARDKVEPTEEFTRVADQLSTLIDRMEKGEFAK